MPNPIDVALIIGVDHYARAGLKEIGAAANADAVETWFFDSCNAIGSHPRIISVRSNVGAGATKSVITGAIGQLCDDCPGPGSRLLFYFSGHGAVDNKCADLLLCEGADDDGLLLDDVVRYFANFPFDKQLFIIDACRSLADNITGISVFTSLHDKPLPRVAHRPQVMKLQSTMPTYDAYADTVRVQKGEPGVPCAHFTTGLIEIAHGRRTEPYRWIAEINGLAVRASSLQDVMQEYLRPYGQQPNIRSEGGEIELWHAPLFFHRLPKPEGDLSPAEPLFPQDVREPVCYRRFVRAALAKLGGLDELQRAVTEVAKGPEKFGASYLAPVDAAAAGWLVKHMLFGEGQPRVDVRTIDLTARGGATIGVFWEMIEKSFGTRDAGILVYGLTEATALYVVMEELNQEEMTRAILTEFWKPVAEQCRGRSVAFYLFLIGSDGRPGPAVEKTPGGRRFVPLSPLSKDLVETWIERFRHELPLPIVQDRRSVADEFMQSRPTLPRLIELICKKLDVDPQWMN
jgi:hypothetical protein